MCIQGLKHLSGKGYFFVVGITNIPNKTKIFSKQKYPAKNESQESAVNQARIYASKLKLIYPKSRVFILNPAVEVTLNQSQGKNT